MLKTVMVELGVAAALLAAPSVVAAQDKEPAPDYTRSGLYVIAAGVFAVENFDTGGNVRKDDTFGADVRIGYRAHRHLAAELNYQYLDQFDLKKGAARTDLRMHAVTLNAKVFPAELLFPKWGRIQPYGLAGLGLAIADADTRNGVFSVDGTEVEFLLRFGGGIDVYLTEHISLIGELGYAIPTGDLDDEEFAPFLVGAMYRF